MLAALIWDERVDMSIGTKRKRTVGSWLLLVTATVGCWPSIGCSGAATNDEEDVGRSDAAATLDPSASLWPTSGGVVSIPYQIVAPDAQGESEEHFPISIGIPPSVQAFQPVLQYVSQVTHNRFQFTPGAMSGARIQFVGKESWADSGASCKTGKHSPTKCAFRLSHIIGVAHRKDGSADPIRVYFADGTYRRTALDDLSAKAPCQDAGCPDPDRNTTVNYPINPQTGAPYITDDVAAIEQSGATIIAWYKNGFVSKGTETDPGSSSAPRAYTHYTVRVGEATFSLPLVAVAISTNGKVHAFWRNPIGPGLVHTLGTSSTELVGAVADQNAVTIPAGESVDDIVGMVYDEQNNLQTYFASAKERYSGNRADLGALGHQNVKMNSARDAFSTILHELTHALGFAHEQQRPDRDTYLSVSSALIKKYPQNYSLLPSAATTGGYDFASIMHYDSTSGFLRRGDNANFSKNYSSYSWRDLRGLLVQYGFTDPQSSAAEEASVAADFSAASVTLKQPPVYSPATAHVMGDIVGMDVEASGPIRTYYAKTSSTGVVSLTGSRGTSYDLGRSPVNGVEEFDVTPPSANGVVAAATDIVGIAISDGEAITWFKSAALGCPSGLVRTRGSLTALDSIWAAGCVALPSGYTADNIRDIARHRYGGVTHVITAYNDGKFSIGGTGDLAADSHGVFDVALGDSLNPSQVDASLIQGFAILNGGAQFFLGCDANVENCGGYEYQYVNVPDFVSRLPAQFQ